MQRRNFLRQIGCGAAIAAGVQTNLLPEYLGGLQNACAFDLSDKLSSVEARFYRKLPEGGIECELCPRHCRITDLERGYCGVRENRADTYHTLVYGLPCAVNIDPIEKKPLYHYHPGTKAFSLATAGCNVNCKFCQNWEISQSRPEQTENYGLSVSDAVALCRERSVPTIAYTYSEPVIFYEYMYDIASRARQDGIKSVVITGGFIEEEPLAQLLPVVDAIKVDLKAIREKFYREIVRGELQPVLDRLVQIKKSNVWLEIVYLIVPTLNDTDAEFRELARWIRDNLGNDTPVHFSRFHPQYLLTGLPPTPLATMDRAYQIARAEGLKFVYLGNVPGHAAESTYCPGCGKIVVSRTGYKVDQINLVDGACSSCGLAVPGRF